MPEIEDSWIQHGCLQPIGVSVLDVLLPIGLPRNNFMLISGESGTGKKILVTELVHRFTDLGEPVIFLTTDNPPIGLYQRFRSLSWDFHKLIGAGKIHIIDAFSGLVEADTLAFKKLSPLNEEIRKHMAQCITPVGDESNLKLIFHHVYSWMDKLDMVNQGVIVIDSLTELYSRVSSRILYNELKTLRAIVCQFRFVPVFCVAHFGVSEEFPKGIDYLADGLIDLRFDPQLLDKGFLLKQIRVRKLADAPILPNWLSFTIQREQGTVPLANPTEYLQEMMDLFEARLTKITGEPIQEQNRHMISRPSENED